MSLESNEKTSTLTAASAAKPDFGSYILDRGSLGKSIIPSENKSSNLPDLKMDKNGYSDQEHKKDLDALKLNSMQDKFEKPPGCFPQPKETPKTKGELLDEASKSPDPKPSKLDSNKYDLTPGPGIDKGRYDKFDFPKEKLGPDSLDDFNKRSDAKDSNLKDFKPKDSNPKQSNPKQSNPSNSKDSIGGKEGNPEISSQSIQELVNSARNQVQDFFKNSAVKPQLKQGEHKPVELNQLNK